MEILQINTWKHTNVHVWIQLYIPHIYIIQHSYIFVFIDWLSVLDPFKDYFADVNWKL